MPEAARTIVKSPPELWAEVSDPEALARHLGAFGEIRITRLEPEATVAWEGDRVRGTVDLSPAGWGTKVRVTAEELEAAKQPEPEPEPEPLPEPVAVAPDPEPEPDPPAQEAVALDQEVAPSPHRGRFRGVWSKWFGRRVVVDDELVLVEEEPVVLAEQPTLEQPPVEVAAPAVAEAPVAEVEPDAAEDTAAVLDGMLESLGSAHHRPFSRG